MDDYNRALGLFFWRDYDRNRKLVQNIYHQGGEEVKALDNVSLSIKEGERYGFYQGRPCEGRQKFRYS